MGARAADVAQQQQQQQQADPQAGKWLAMVSKVLLLLSLPLSPATAKRREEMSSKCRLLKLPKRVIIHQRR